MSNTPGFAFNRQNTFPIIIIFTGLFLLVQAIFYSNAPFMFSLLLLGSISLYAFLPRLREQLFFYLIPLGPLLNLVAVYRDQYLYNMEVVLLAFLGLWLLLNFKKRGIDSWDTFSGLFLFLLSITFLSTLIHLFSGRPVLPELRVIRAYVIGGYLVIYFSMIRHQIAKVIEGFYKATLIGEAIIIFVALVEYGYRVLFKQNGPLEPRSLFNGSETLAAYLGLTLPFIFVNRNLTGRRAWRVGAVLIFILGFVVLLATRSRSVLIALLVMSVIYIFNAWRYRDKKQVGLFVRGLIIFLMAGLSVVFTKTSYAGEPFSGNLLQILRRLFFTRTENWQAGVSYLVSSPFWGNGAVENVYNLYLQIAAQYGIIALGLFMILIFSLINRAFRTGLRSTDDSSFPEGLLWGICVFSVAGLGESMLGNQLGYLIWSYLLILNFSLQPSQPGVELSSK